MTSINIPTQRFKYSECVASLLDDFANIHRYDERNDFQQYWGEYIQKHNIAFKNESESLTERGFNGDPYNAMYKSTRFYYRKMHLTDNNSKQSAKNRSYNRFPAELIALIDAKIENYISSNLTQITDNNFICKITPASCYKNFCLDYESEITKYIREYIKEIKAQCGNVSINIISEKLKKTFKNRFYKIQEKLRNKPHK